MCAAARALRCETRRTRPATNDSSRVKTALIVRYTTTLVGYDLLSSKLEIRSIADGARVAGARFDFFQSRRGVALVAKRLKRRQRLVKLILHVKQTKVL